MPNRTTGILLVLIMIPFFALYNFAVFRSTRLHRHNRWIAMDHAIFPSTSCLRGLGGSGLSPEHLPQETDCGAAAAKATEAEGADGAGHTSPAVDAPDPPQLGPQPKGGPLRAQPGGADSATGAAPGHADAHATEQAAEARPSGDAALTAGGKPPLRRAAAAEPQAAEKPSAVLPPHAALASKASPTPKDALPPGGHTASPAIQTGTVAEVPPEQSQATPAKGTAPPMDAHAAPGGGDLGDAWLAAAGAAGEAEPPPPPAPEPEAPTSGSESEGDFPADVRRRSRQAALARNFRSRRLASPR
jgi:hypothetical protein